MIAARRTPEVRPLFRSVPTLRGAEFVTVMLTWKIEELLETKPEEQEYPAILYRGDALRREGCNCSGLVPKYAEFFCHHRGEPVTEGDELLKQIKTLLKTYLKGTEWWKKMPKPISNWEALLLAQHYGLGTRFQDWTWDPRVALYFATHKVQGEKLVPKTEEDGDAVVWICDLDKATRKDMPQVRDWYVDPNEEPTPFWRREEKLKTRFFKPTNDLGDRVKNQKSVMCRQVFYPSDQPYKHCGMVSLDKNIDFEDAMSRVTISTYDYTKIGRELIKHDIVVEGIFPDANEKDCDGLERALRLLSNWPEC